MYCTAVTAVSALKKMAFLGSFGSKIRNVWHLPTKISWQPEVVGVAGASCFCLESYTHLDFFLHFTSCHSVKCCQDHSAHSQEHLGVVLWPNTSLYCSHRQEHIMREMESTDSNISQPRTVVPRQVSTNLKLFINICRRKSVAKMCRTCSSAKFQLTK